MKTYHGTVDRLVENFWLTDTMYDEAILLVAQTDTSGAVISAPKAKLLFPAQQVLSVKQYYHANNNGQIVEFAEGEHFIYRDGYIEACGTFETDAATGLATFRCVMPYVTDKQLTGEDTFPGLRSGDTTIPSTDEGLYLPFTEGRQIVQMQLAVTYTHEVGLWTGDTAVFQGDALPKTLKKLENKEPIELFVYGASVFVGANSSCLLQIPPYLKTFPELFAENLSQVYGTQVNLTNRSMGGFTSNEGLHGGVGWWFDQKCEQVGLEELLNTGELATYSPDLVILGFGGNDVTWGIPFDTYRSNMLAMIRILRERNPDCEIILMAVGVANPKAKNQSKQVERFYVRLPEIIAAAGGNGFADVHSWKMQLALLQTGKRYIELSANGVNHPNDFLARICAMYLTTTLVDYDRLPRY